MITIVRVVETCVACPSQWDGWDTEGKYYYLRYRFGCGTMTHYPGGPNFWERPEEEGELIASFGYGGAYDGDIRLTQFARHAGISLDPKLSETTWEQHFAQQLKTALAEAAEEDETQL